MDRIDKFLDKLEGKFAHIRERGIDGSVCGLCEYDGAYIGESGDWCNECPGFEQDDCFKLKEELRKKWTDEILAICRNVGSSSEISNNSDTVSRRQAIDVIRAMQTYKLFAGDDLILVDQAGAMTELMMLPSAQPETNEGEWIVHLYKFGASRYECDSCHARCDTIYPYCPYCGEKKEGERNATN